MPANKTSNQNILRSTALIVALFGAMGSLIFMFRAGSKQHSIILLGLFTTWVLSPYVGLFILNKMVNNWPIPARVLLYWLMIMLTLFSLIAYSGAFNMPKSKNAFIFLIFPLISWFFIVLIFFIARRISKKNRNS